MEKKNTTCGNQTVPSRHQQIHSRLMNYYAKNTSSQATRYLKLYGNKHAHYINIMNYSPAMDRYSIYVYGTIILHTCVGWEDSSDQHFLDCT